MKWKLATLIILVSGTLIALPDFYQQPGSVYKDDRCARAKDQCLKWRCQLQQMLDNVMAGKLEYEKYELESRRLRKLIEEKCDTVPPPPPDTGDCNTLRHIVIQRPKDKNILEFRICLNRFKPTTECCYDDAKELILSVNRPAGFDSLRAQPFISLLNKNYDSYASCVIPEFNFNFKGEKSDWENNKNSPYNEFRFVIPSGTGEEVWLVQSTSSGSKNGKLIPIPELKASWFDAIRSKKFQSIGFLNKLAICAGNDPSMHALEPILLDTVKGVFRALVTGNAEKGKFLLGFTGNQTFAPFDSQNPFFGQQGNDLLIEKLVRSSGLDSRVKSMFEDFLKNNELGTGNLKIIAALPSNVVGRIGSPQEFINLFTDLTKFKDIYLDLLRSSSNVDLLLKNGCNYYVWRHGELTFTEINWLEDCGWESNCKVKGLLGIVDPNLEILSQESGNMVFHFKGNRSAVWALTGDCSLALKANPLVKPADIFLFSGKPISDYFQQAQGNLTDKEQAFLNRWALQPNQFKLLDWTPTNSNERLLVYGKSSELQTHTNQNSGKFYKLLQRDGNDSPLTFILTNGVWGDNCKGIRERLTGWRREKFLSPDIIQSAIPGIEIWMSSYRIATVMTYVSSEKNVMVYLPPSERNFGPAALSCIRQILKEDEITYKSNSIPQDLTLFQGWLADTKKWDRNVWRANPLGFIERCKQQQIQ